MYFGTCDNIFGGLYNAVQTLGDARVVTVLFQGQHLHTMRWNSRRVVSTLSLFNGVAHLSRPWCISAARGSAPDHAEGHHERLIGFN